MDLIEALMTVILFFILTPGILLTLPLGNKFAVALAHGVVFVTIVYLLNGDDVTENFQKKSKFGIPVVVKRRKRVSS